MYFVVNIKIKVKHMLYRNYKMTFFLLTIKCAT